MNKRVKHSLLLTIVGLFLATSVWGDAFDPSVNIAQGKEAKAGWSRRGDCPNKNAGEIPDKAVDGNTGSHFIAYANNSANLSWWAVDLGDTYRLNSLNAVWNNGRTPSHYLIQVMTETPSDFADDVVMSDESWVTVLDINESQTEGTSGNHYDFGAISAKYIRLVSKNRKEIGLSEFEIYADAPASEPVVTPTLVSASMYSDLAEGSTTLTLTATDHNGDALNTFLVQDQMGKFYRVTTDGSNHAVISGLDNRRYAFTVWAIEEGCLSASSMSVIVGASTFDAETNLALNQPSYAVRFQQNNSDRAAEKANDGSLSSLWNAGSDSGEEIAEEDRNNIWWYVDLQDQYEIKYISLYWTLAYANSFIVQVRKNAPTLADAGDDSAWETFLDYSGPQTNGGEEANGNLYGDVTGAKAAFSVTPKGRYVRFRAKDANAWNWGVQIREFRIYGNGYLPLDNTAPVISSASYNGVTADYTGVKFNITASDNITSAANLVYNVKDQNEVSHNAVYSDGVITVTDMPTSKNVTVTIYVEDEAGNHSDGYDVTITYLNPTDNLALEKSSYACQDWHDQPTIEGIDKANDGKTSTYWTSYPYGTTTNEWWYVDLGDFYDLRRIEVEWKSTTEYYSMDFSIQYRQNAPAVDGATSGEWETLASGMSGNQNVDIADAQARYICLRSASRYNSGNQLQLAELRVFGKTFATPDNEAPTISAASYNGVSADWTELKFNITVSDNVTSNDDLVYVIEDPNGAEHAATYSAGVLTVTGMPTFKNGDFTIYATDAVDNKSNGYVVENVSYVNPTDNIAKNKSAYGCVNLGGGEAPGVAIDGKENTDWTSWSNADHTNDWWYVDLGDYYDIRRIEVVWTTDRHSTDYDIQYRQYAPEVDGATASEWHTISEFAGKSGNQTVDIVDTKAQYICMRSRSGNTGDQVRLAEFRVYGKSFAPKDLTAPVISAASYNGISADGTELKFNITVLDNVTANDDLVYVVEDPDGAEHAASYSAGVLSVTGMPTFKNSSVTIYATDAVDNRSEGFVVWSVSYVDPTENLAYHKDAYACVHINDGEGRLMPVDGNTATTWTSYSHTHHDNDWWYVDLGDVYDIRRIEVVWQENRHSTDFSIQYRENAPEGDSGATEDEWETKYSNLSGDQELVDITDMQARYICMRSKDYVHDQEHAQVRMAEFRVFGREFTYANAITLSESTNNSSVIAANDGRDVNVTLARGFDADGGNYTLCLPFNMTAEQCAEAFHDGYQLWYLEDSRLKDNGDIYLNFISADNIVAGRPYLFCPAENVASGTVIENVRINSAASTASNSTYANFVGTYDKILQETLNANTKAYLLGADNWLFSAENLRKDMKALRAYFELNPDVVNNVHPRMRVVFNEPRTDMPTDIEEVEQIVAPAKRIVNGQLIIEKNGILYNAQGKRLQ